MAARHRRTGSVQPGAGCIAWILVMVAIALLFALNAGTIRDALKNTDFFRIIGNAAATRPESGTAPGSVPTTVPVTKAPATKAPAAKTPATTVPSAAEPSAAAPAPVTSNPALPPAPGSAAGVKSRPTSLYFVRIESDGVITRQEVKRAIPTTDTPLADALQALLAGPTEEELRRSYMTLIPRGTRLLGVALRGSTATVDLSESFMYNKYGIEGYAGQLKQIVYTATAFAGVQDVQILIEGAARDYLGGEGVYIGKPISRNSF